MLFSSVTFLFMFLPLLCLVCFLTDKKYHNFILLLASIIFYAWGEPKFLFIMLLSVFINWLGAILIDMAKNIGSLKKFLLFFVVLANLSILFYFKYFNFVIENINNLFGGNFDFVKVVLPLGISFYTFQALSYVIDVYRGEVKVQKSLYKTALFICLFPQLIAGPIIKYHDIEEQIESRELSHDKVLTGVQRFVAGLAKKVILANTMGEVADKIFSQSPDTFSHLTAWFGAIAYSLQLYFDFSGYSDMAIGLGLIFGFKFMENFKYPYISKSITEFWRRWHISLSTWFKEYVYIVLGGNRNGRLKQIRNLGIVFLLTGIWHGAAWTFIFWGIWNGFFIIFEKLTGWDKDSEKVGVKVLKHLYCITVFVTGWVIFRSDSLAYACKYIKNMFGLINPSESDYLYAFPYYADGMSLFVFAAAILCSLPIFKDFFSRKTFYGKVFAKIWLIVLLLCSSASIAVGTYNPFIYFRF
ncbi:MAG: hypothetical protein K6C94_04175 [Candidatus Gastranaerophilales bacterium]|nr:hypothetical protein [Candidatus Gastranaerophilales bacterium]